MELDEGQAASPAHRGVARLGHHSRSSSNQTKAQPHRAPGRESQVVADAAASRGVTTGANRPIKQPGEHRSRRPALAMSNTREENHVREDHQPGSPAGPIAPGAPRTRRRGRPVPRTPTVPPARDRAEVRRGRRSWPRTPVPSPGFSCCDARRTVRRSSAGCASSRATRASGCFASAGASRSSRTGRLSEATPPLDAGPLVLAQGERPGERRGVPRTVRTQRRSVRALRSAGAPPPRRSSMRARSSLP
jgi:hypothetical protein